MRDYSRVSDKEKIQNKKDCKPFLGMTGLVGSNGGSCSKSCDGGSSEICNSDLERVGWLVDMAGF